MLGTFGAKKEHTAVLNSRESVTVKAGQDILSAALFAGLKWTHGCRKGDCGKCRCVLRKGKIKRRTDFTNTLTPDELQQGVVLACQSLPKSDLEIDVELSSDAAGVAPVNVDGVIAETRSLTHDILEVVVQCDSPPPDGMLAGQYAEMAYPGLSRPRSYSFARSPQRETDNRIRFFIRKVPGGVFTEWLFAADRAGVRLSLALPFGDFYLREGVETMVCLAGGSGMSAVKAVLEHARDSGAKRDVLFLFGARTQNDLYCADEMRELASTWTEGYKFEYVEVLSNEPEDGDWRGARGYVTDHLVNNYLSSGALDIKQCQAYMCGPPPMVDAFIEILNREGLAEDGIFYDKFADASTSPESAAESAAGT